MVAIPGRSIAHPGAPSPNTLAQFNVQTFKTPAFLGTNFDHGTNGIVNTVATRFYMTPIYIPLAVTLTALAVFNQTTTDTGELIRLGLYDANRNLVVAASEITLTAAAAARAQTISQAVTPGWYTLAQHYNSVTAMYAMSDNLPSTNAGFVRPWPGFNEFGTINALQTKSDPPEGWAGHYLDTAYTTLPSTLPTPTASLARVPWCGIKW